MVSSSTWLLITVGIIGILIIAVGIGWIIRNNQPAPAPPSDSFTQPLTWTKPYAGSDPDKNICQIYQFPITMNQGLAYLGTPTFNYDVLSGMTGRSLTGNICLDSDQLIAQQVEHKCTGPNGLNDQSIVLCNTLTGGFAKYQETETFYSNILCEKYTGCPGELSLVSLNFQGQGTNPYCIAKDATSVTGPLTMKPCDPSDSTQLFRITRTDPGTDPTTLGPGGAQNGVLAQILDRDSGLCLVGGGETSTFDGIPTYLSGVNSSCTGGGFSFSGTLPVMGACTGGPYPGYVWAIIPGLDYCGISGGCSGCIRDASRAENTNYCCGIDINEVREVCSNDPRFVRVGFESIPTGQQIYYLGDIDYTQIAVTGTQDEFFESALQLNMSRLVFGGPFPNLTLRPAMVPLSQGFYDTGVISGPYGQSVCDGYMSIGQFITIQLYNALVNQANSNPTNEQITGNSYCFL